MKMIIVPMTGLLSFAASAQEVVEIETLEFLEYAVQMLGGVKGASAFAIAGIIVQVLIKFMASKLAGQLFKRLSGQMKLMIVLGLSYVAGVLSLVNVGEMSLTAALVHSTSLSALLVLGNQIYKLFFQKKESQE